MDDKFATALINAFARQREQAMNHCAQLEAQLETTAAELTEAKAALAERTVDATDPLDGLATDLASTARDIKSLKNGSALHVAKTT